MVQPLTLVDIKSGSSTIFRFDVWSLLINLFYLADWSDYIDLEIHINATVEIGITTTKTLSISNGKFSSQICSVSRGLWGQKQLLQ